MTLARSTRRRAIDVVAPADLRHRGCAQVAASRAEARRSERDDHHQLPQRNSVVVDCSIWSAALIDLGVHLVGALRGDQVGDFRDHFDVGLFEVALLMLP